MDTHVITIGFFGVGPTEIRLGFICYNFFLLTMGPTLVNTPFGPTSPLDGLVVLVITAVLISLIVAIWSEGRRLAREEAVAR
jgi:hypothetical protein